MHHPDAIYSREEISPDGTLRICYNYSEGEKTPTVVEPCVVIIATGEVLFDLWRTRINGRIDDFIPTGFRLIASDNYGRATIEVRVEVLAKTFNVVGDPAPPRPLTRLEEFLYRGIESVRLEGAAGASPPPARSSITTRIADWFIGRERKS